MPTHVVSHFDRYTAIAAKAMLQLNFDDRETELRETKPATPKEPA